MLELERAAVGWASDVVRTVAHCVVLFGRAVARVLNRRLLRVAVRIRIRVLGGDHARVERRCRSVAHWPLGH